MLCTYKVLALRYRTLSVGSAKDQNYTSGINEHP